MDGHKEGVFSLLTSTRHIDAIAKVASGNGDVGHDGGIDSEVSLVVGK